MDQHELIGLIAPRPFLLIGGDEFDKKGELVLHQRRKGCL